MPKTTNSSAAAAAAAAPSNPPDASPSPSPSPAPSSSAADAFVLPSASKIPVDFSPPLIAMVVVVAAAFLIVTYSRLISRHLLPPLLRLLRRFSRWRRRRRRRRSYLPSSSAGDLDSPRFGSPPFDAALHALSPYGLDESVIKTLPLAIYTAKSGMLLEDARECAVCLVEFEEDDYVRTLPVCSHAFHVDCIDVWLRAHANCPLCRACIFRPQSPFVPLMAARIRPSLDDSLLRSIALSPLTESINPDSHRTTATEITQTTEEASPPPNRINSDDRFPNGRDFFLKRSYSFGFERSVASERNFLEPATTSPWRYRRGTGGGSFWKRPSPFGSVSKASRVFSFRSYRNMNMKSPAFFRRRGFTPLSESSVRFSATGSSTRRTKSMTSPMFSIRSSSTAPFSSSRLRCGDPEALLSPERFNRT